MALFTIVLFLVIVVAASIVIHILTSSPYLMPVLISITCTLLTFTVLGHSFFIWSMVYTASSLLGTFLSQVWIRR